MSSRGAYTESANTTKTRSELLVRIQGAEDRGASDDRAIKVAIMGTAPLNSVAGGKVVGGKGSANGARDFVEVR